jgi:(1->4)-alpha-D-glucan 1-alpha-D-glucosylmutase
VSRVAPRATYRLQLHAGFDLDAAAAIVPYLDALGVSHVYCSPILQAAPGSSHGYDVVDHARVSVDLGGDAALERLVTALHQRAMGLVVDVVPNHMAISGTANRWWWDVLEHGHASRYASYFDVDWDPPESRLRNVILLPILPDHYGRVLEAGGIAVVRDGARLLAAVGDRHLPLDPRSLGEPLVPRRPSSRGRTSSGSSAARSASCRRPPLPTRPRSPDARRMPPSSGSGSPWLAPRPRCRRRSTG